MIKLKIVLSVIAFEVLLSLETVLFRFSYYFDTYFDDENKLIPDIKNFLRILCFSFFLYNQRPFVLKIFPIGIIATMVGRGDVALNKNGPTTLLKCERSSASLTKLKYSTPIL